MSFNLIQIMYNFLDKLFSERDICKRLISFGMQYRWNFTTAVYN